MNIRKHPGANKTVEFVGMYTKKDLQSEKKRLESIIDNQMEQGEPCQYDLSTGLVHRSFDCVSLVFQVTGSR